MIDRKRIPDRKPVTDVKLFTPEEKRLSNEIPITIVNTGSQDLVRIEFLFDAGINREHKSLLASFANDLIDEGTANYSAEALAEKLDFYGAFIETEIHFDHASLIVYSLNKHLNSVLPIVEEFLKKASYPDADVATYAANQQQKFEVSNEKVNNICRRKFNELLFGPEHMYGRTVKSEDYTSITATDLRNFHSNYYQAGNCKVIMAGQVKESSIKLVDKHFGGKDWFRPNNSPLAVSRFKTATRKKNFIEKKDALQSAIRIGRITFNRFHPDFLDMQVMNTVLGGYFGSRLMSNIREDKGYTYGIGSAVSSLLYSGCFFIATEVGADVCKAALKEIYLEIDRLRKEKVHKDELETVKNYLLGSYLSSIDGPFQIAERIRTLKLFGLGPDHYEKYILAIRAITPERIQQLANHYLQEADLLEVVVGKR